MLKNRIINRDSSGFTLVEMLVVMGIFSIILGGVLKVFDTGNYTYKVQEDVAEMQQNLRVSKMFLEKDVRMAGCDMRELYVYESEVFPLVFQNGAGLNGSDRLVVNYIDHSANSCEGVLPDLTTSGPNGNSYDAAAARVNEELSDSPYDAWDNPFVCNGETYGNTNPFTEFMAIIREADGSKSDIVWVTNIMNNGGGTEDKVQNRPYPNGCPGGCNKIINNYDPGAVLSFFDTRKLKRYAYYVEANALKRDTLAPSDGTTVLSTDIIAINIEDLQFAFGLDTDGDNFVDTWIGDSLPAALSNTQSRQVRLVRITILGRTATEHRGIDIPRPSLENNAEGSTSDGYRRKQLQVTVKVRNLGLS